MNRIQRIATVSAVGAAVLVPTSGAVVAVAKPDPGPPLPESSVSDPQTQVEHDRAPAPIPESGVPWEAIGLAAVAGAAVTAGTMVVRRRREAAKPASA